MKDESTSDMAVKACRKALDRMGMEPENLDLVISTTDVPDFVASPTSAVIQHKLSAENAGTFDINAACTDDTIGLRLDHSIS